MSNKQKLREWRLEEMKRTYDWRESHGIKWLLRFWLHIYTWREMHYLTFAGGAMFYGGALLLSVFYLQIHYPPLGAVLFWSVFILLVIGAATVDAIRKQQSI